MKMNKRVERLIDCVQYVTDKGFHLKQFDFGLAQEAHKKSKLKKLINNTPKEGLYTCLVGAVTIHDVLENDTYKSYAYMDGESDAYSEGVVSGFDGHEISTYPPDSKGAKEYKKGHKDARTAIKVIKEKQKNSEMPQFQLFE